MSVRMGDYKGKVQGKCYRLWRIGDSFHEAKFEVEKIWGAGPNGVIFESEHTGREGYYEAKQFLKRIGAVIDKAE